ncbi:MAG: helix-turn-helix domain-containing protein, partial [Chloroflexota bacterium]
LENLVERAAVMAQGGLIAPEHIVFSHAAVAGSTAGPLDIEQAIRRGQALPSIVAGLERRAVQFAMYECSGDRNAAARLLGIERNVLEEKLRTYDLEGGEEEAAQ